MIFNSSHNYWNMTEIPERLGYIGMNLRQIFVRKKRLAIFYRENKVNIDF